MCFEIYIKLKNLEKILKILVVLFFTKKKMERKTKARKVKTTKDYTTPELMSVLGKVFTCSHCHRRPDVVQVIGWLN